MSERDDSQRSRRATETSQRQASSNLPRNVVATSSMKPAHRHQARHGGDSDSGSSEGEDDDRGQNNGGRPTDYSIATYLVKVFCSFIIFLFILF